MKQVRHLLKGDIVSDTIKWKVYEQLGRMIKWQVKGGLNSVATMRVGRITGTIRDTMLRMVYEQRYL